MRVSLGLLPNNVILLNPPNEIPVFVLVTQISPPSYHHLRYIKNNHCIISVTLTRLIIVCVCAAFTIKTDERDLNSCITVKFEPVLIYASLSLYIFNAVGWVQTLT